MHTALSDEINACARKTVQAAFSVHTNLGPGLLESVYRTCLAYELTKCGLAVQTEVQVPITYDSILLDTKLRIDMLVENCLLVELKSVETMHSVFEAQVLTYLKLTNLRLGLLINFNEVHLKNGIRRLIS